MKYLSSAITLSESDYRITAIYAQGAGGQHVNKRSNAVHLRFDIRQCSLPESEKHLLLTASHHLITASGVIIIKSQGHRSQQMNRQAALARLQTLIYQLTRSKKKRRPSRPTLAVNMRRLEAKKRKAVTKKRRADICFSIR